MDKSKNFTRNVIRCRYSLLEVPRRGIHNVIATAMSICVAYSNKVMGTRLPLPVGSGDKYDVSSGVQYGRSMIEMLGVLAIIAVLSVGGIAGYSKAMSSFRHNKWLYQIETLIFNIKDVYKFQGQYGQGSENLLPTMKAIGAVPSGMLDANDRDLFGNRVAISMRPWSTYTRMNLKFQMLANADAVQNCHDLLHLVTVYPNYIWVVGVCAGNNCDGQYFYRICGKIAPKNYIPIDRCSEYNLTEVMTACKICSEQSCTALVLFDNNT